MVVKSLNKTEATMIGRLRAIVILEIQSTT